MKKLNKKDIIRIIAAAVFLLVIITATFLLIPFFSNIGTDEGRELMQKQIGDMGIKGVFMFLGLQIIQVIVALIPGEPVEIISGVLYGGFWGMCLCILGLLVGTIMVYYLVKKVGKPLVNTFVTDEQLQKFEFLRNESKLEIIIFILFLIPGTPKDTLTYFVPLTKIKPLRFFLISTFARIPSIITSTLMGEYLGQGKWVLMVIVFVLTCAIGIVGLLLNKKFIASKNKK